jgi:threonine/homoserine/homoserine lactone efflux protein
MNLATLVAFVLLELTLCLIPGPAVLLTLSYALRRGTRGGLSAACGILAGNTLYFLLSGLGVVALLLASYQVFTVLKWAGALYLAFLGLRALFARRGIVPDESALQRGEGGRAFVSGFVTQVSNPKAIVFFAAILPQFIDPHGVIWLQLVILTVTSFVIELAVLTGYTLAADRLRRSPAAERASLWIERAGGAILIGIAARIVREPLVGAP